MRSSGRRSLQQSVLLSFIAFVAFTGARVQADIRSSSSSSPAQSVQTQNVAPHRPSSRSILSNSRSPPPGRKKSPRARPTKRPLPKLPPHPTTLRKPPPPVKKGPPPPNPHSKVLTPGTSVSKSPVVQSFFSASPPPKNPPPSTPQPPDMNTPPQLGPPSGTPISNTLIPPPTGTPSPPPPRPARPPPRPPPRPPTPRPPRPPPPPSRAALAMKLQANSAIRTAVRPPTRLRNGGILGQIPLKYKDAAYRTGTYFLPSQYRYRAVPVLVVFHGLEGNGIGMVQAFMAAAERNQFAIVGVDSNSIFRWSVPKSGADPTSDIYHALACLDYLSTLNGVRVDKRRISSAGISMGGYIAAAIATRYPIFSSGMVFHSKFLLNELGPLSPRLWLSTGQRDPIEPPWAARILVADLARARPKYPAVTLRVYQTGHCFTCIPKEMIEAMQWWLAR